MPSTCLRGSRTARIPVASARRLVVAAAVPFDRPWDEVTLSYERPGSASESFAESMKRDDIDKPPYAVFHALVPSGPWHFVMRAGDSIERSADHSIPADPTDREEVYLLDE